VGTTSLFAAVAGDRVAAEPSVSIAAGSVAAQIALVVVSVHVRLPEILLHESGAMGDR
jgi:hypothetical protein